MKNKKQIKIPWNIIVIVICVLAFSILCWIRFAKNIIHRDIKELMSRDAINTAWNENIYEKARISKVDILYTFGTTGELVSTQVVLGADKWLFYKSSSDGNPIGDFEGTNYYSQEEMDNILESALNAQEKIEAKGIEFLLFIPPNKENVYYDKMPDIYKHAKISRTDILIEYLKNNGVNIINPKEELLKYKDKYQVYYPCDTHWNNIGGYIGAKQILDFWNIDFPSLSEREIKSSQLTGTPGGDLLGMVSLNKYWPNNEIAYTIIDQKLGEEDLTDKIVASNNAICYLNINADLKKTVLIVGDSFRTNLAPALSEKFSKIYAIHRADYTSDLIEKIKPDYLIVEYVERYSNQVGGIDFLIR